MPLRLILLIHRANQLHYHHLPGNSAFTGAESSRARGLAGWAWSAPTTHPLWVDTSGVVLKEPGVFLNCCKQLV